MTTIVLTCRDQGTKNRSVPWHCPTIRALDEENAQSRAPQHPNTYRQPEGNRA